MGGEDEGLRIYRFSVVDDRCPHRGWRVSTAYVLASSEGETKNLVENGIRLCGSVGLICSWIEVILLSKVKRSTYAPQKPRALCLIINDL